MELKKYIRDVPDFPKEGILYRDITPLLKDHEAFTYVVNQLSNNIPDSVNSVSDWRHNICNRRFT